MNNTTRRYPRTLAEAFGPYTSRHVHPMPEPRHPRERWFVIACVICFVLGFIATYGSTV